MSFLNLSFLKPPFSIRDYQELSIQLLVEAFNNKETPVLCLPTGTGKTVVILEFFRRIFLGQYKRNKIKKFIIAVPFIELVDRFKKDSVTFGIEPFVEVHTYKHLTLHYQNYDPKQFYMVAIDECHHIKADGLSKVFDHFSRCKRFGTSATPKRLDGLPLNPPFTCVIQPHNDQWFEDHGWISPIKIYQKPLADLDVYGEDDRLDMQDELLDHPVIFGNITQNWRLYAYGVPTIGFAPSVNCGKKFTQAFNDEFRSEFGKDIAVFLDSGTPKKIRKDSVEAVMDGGYLVPFNVGLFIEGLDIPIVKCLLMLRKTASKSIYKQMIGRIRRPTGQTGIMLDFVGNFSLHNHPNIPERYDLKGDKNKLDKGDIPTQCPKCEIDLIRSTDQLTCLICGYAYKMKPVRSRGKRKPPLEVDGILAELKDHPSKFMIAAFIEKWHNIGSKKKWSMAWGVSRVKEVLKTYPDTPNEMLLPLLTAVGYNINVSVNLLSQIQIEMKYLEN